MTRATARRRGGAGGPVVRSRAWLEWNGRSLLGKGQLELLAQIEALGSISAAGRVMGVSYRLAWAWIEEMSVAAGQPLIRTATGGRGGGGAALTDLGRALLAAVRLLSVRLAEFDERMTEDLARFFASAVPAPRATQRRRHVPQRRRRD
jgi:molybdate transport repressor ModE-like protein